MKDKLDINHYSMADGTVMLGKGLAPEIYFDGVSQMLMGHPITKLTCHATVEPRNGETPEYRKAVAILSVPTGALVELALNILSSVKHNEGTFANSSQEVHNRSMELINSFNLQWSPPEPKN